MYRLRLHGTTAVSRHAIFISYLLKCHNQFNPALPMSSLDIFSPGNLIGRQVYTLIDRSE